MTYIFLTPNFNESGETKYFAIPANKIETLNVADTYDRHGQQVGHENAGDYHMDNEQSDAKKDCIAEIHNKFSIDKNDIHIVNSAGDFIVDSGDGNDYGFDESAVNQFIAEWREKEENIVTCKGFDYWDGSNWKTIIVEYEFHGEPSHNIVDDEELVAELNEAIENKEFVNEGFGCKNYESGNWIAMDSYWQGTWASYIVTEKEA